VALSVAGSQVTSSRLMANHVLKSHHGLVRLPPDRDG
jgi:hypothetical protein